MKFFTVLRVPLVLAGCLPGIAGCSKPAPAAPPPPANRTMATPTPSPARDLTDIASDKIKHKTDKAIKALSGMLRSESPQLQAKMQKLADKIARDKDGWRKKLEQKRDELRPQIDQLKEQVAKAEGKSKTEVDQQLAALEAQSHNAEKKLTELEGSSGDAWKKIKAQLKEAESKGDVTKDDGTEKSDADMPPTPSPTP